MASIPLEAREASELARTLPGINRTDALETPMAMADVIGDPPAETVVPRAWLLFRRGAFQPMSAAARSPAQAARMGKIIVT